MFFLAQTFFVLFAGKDRMMEVQTFFERGGKDLDFIFSVEFYEIWDKVIEKEML